MKQTRKAFTLIELLVVVAIIALLVSILMPALGRAKEMAKRVQCSANLHDLGIAVAIYQAENRGSNPVNGDTKHGSAHFGLGSYNEDFTDNTFGRWADCVFDWRPIPTMVGGCLFLLVKHADVNPKVYICPSDDDAIDINIDLAITSSGGCLEDWEDLHDFQSMLNLSYSYNDPFNNILDDSAGASLVLMADANPKFDTPRGLPDDLFGIQPRTTDNMSLCSDDFTGDWTDDSDDPIHISGNSKNHRHEMQNVLFADGHVKQHQNPRAGTSQDNIYTYWGGGPTSGCLGKASGLWTSTSKQYHGPSGAPGAKSRKDSYLGF